MTLGLCSGLLLAAAATEPHRVALVVGANEAAPGRSKLRYAHDDARAMADALVQVGRFARGDVVVLMDPEPDAVLERLDALTAQIPGEGETLLLFYYSGHADDRSLYPAGKALPLAALRQHLGQSRATVLLGIIDACRGGGWTQAKGLTAEPPFEIQTPLDLASEGSVLIASSTGLEAAHESEALQGSFFTHHFVAGMLGAAAHANPDLVMLAEAFSYAQEHTVRDTAMQVGTPQHPSFSINLKGRSDLALASLSESPTAVTVHETRGPLQVIASRTGVALLEIPEGRKVVKLAVAPGRYIVRRTDGAQVWGRELDVEAGKTATLDEDSLVLVAGPGLASKGAADGWRAEVSISGDGRVAPSAVSFDGEVGASYYVRPLVDDGETPYGLLSFMQHPDTVSAEATVGSSQGFGGDLSGVFYPWRTTGFTASFGLSDAWSSTNSSGLGVAFSVGLRHYFLPTLRVSAAYNGGLNQQSFSGEPDMGIGLAGSSYHIGTVDASLLLLSHRLLLTTAVSVNYYGASSTQASPYTETYGSASLSATAYFTRSLALGLAGTVGGGTSNQASDMFSAAASVELGWFVTRWLEATVKYQATWQRDWGSLPPGFSHLVEAGVGARF